MRKTADIPSGFGRSKSLKEQVDEIVRDSSIGYDQKLKALTRILSKHEAVLLIGSDPKDEITLRDHIAGSGQSVFLVIEKKFFDQIMSGEKKEEYRIIPDTMPGRYTYKGKDGRRYLRPYERIHFAVGYHRNREEADVEVTDIKTDGELVTFSLGRIIAHYPITNKS